MIFNSAKYLLAAVGALSFTSYSAVHGQEAGMNCPISSKVWCKLDNGDDCETLEQTDFRPDSCGPRRITMYYEYCNLKDSNNVRPIQKKTVAKFRNEIINIDLEKDTDMRGNGCRTATYTTVINNCDIIWVAGDLKFEGNRLDSNNEIIVAWDPTTKQSNEDYCYAYDIYKKRVVSKDQAPTGPELPYPKPDIDVTIECEVESTPGNGFYNSSCQKIPMDSSLPCLRDVKYTYTVRNTGEFDAILHSAIDNERKNILEGGSAIVAAGTSWSKEEFKQRIENYFKFSESSYVLQHIAEHPMDYHRWFEVFCQIEKNILTDSFITRRQQESLRDNLSRFLESYMSNIGLDLISGLIRLLLDDFDNADGAKRLRSSLNRIRSFEEEVKEQILDGILWIGSHLKESQKTILSEELARIFDSTTELKTIYNALGSDYILNTLIGHYSGRLDNINQKLYEELREIR